MYLADVNFWLALTFESHFQHAAAKSWFEALTDERCSYCRLTQQGFLRLVTNPQAFGEEAVSMSAAWQMYNAFLGDPRVVFSEEPVNLELL
jgi:toxin-antitoxin system PIN domain toxin